ncbi:hypothetical protein [Streptomyces ramulosus]|uniref:hypothetical protein n=1 Tax=Streptomyces TaxID=1883 RepID=UPI0031E9D829
MNSWLHRRSLQLWTRLHRGVDSDDAFTKWSSWTVGIVLVFGVCTVLGHVATWVCEFVGVPPYATSVVGLLVLMNVFCVALVAVTAGPGRTRGLTLLMTVAAVTGFVLFIAWPR